MRSTCCAHYAASRRRARPYAAEIAPACGANAVLAASWRALEPRLAAATPEGDARRLCENMALALQSALLVRAAPASVADAFCSTRLGGAGGRSYGVLPAGADIGAILARQRTA